jgi:bacterioferritin-associated ferredoxin
MIRSSTFKKTYCLNFTHSTCKIELDRQDQNFTVFNDTKVAAEYKRGQVLENLLDHHNSRLSIEHFFLYHLDSEESIDQRSLSAPAPSLCRCFFVTEEMIHRKFSEGHSALGVSEITGAGSLCGKCLPDLCRSFYKHKAEWGFDQQKVRTKKTSPAEIVLFLGEEFPQIKIENFFENCLYYSLYSSTIEESEIKAAVWSKYKERIVTVLV